MDFVFSLYFSLPLRPSNLVFVMIQAKSSSMAGSVVVHRCKRVEGALFLMSNLLLSFRLSCYLSLFHNNRIILIKNKVS